MGTLADGEGSTYLSFLVENQFDALGLTPLLEIIFNKKCRKFKAKRSDSKNGKIVLTKNARF